MTEAVASKRGARIESVDVVRGAMIIMALDHVRDYFSNPGFEPTDLAHTSVALFFTRWITHFCAPVFFLLTGTGAYLSLRKQSPAQLSRFLFARGLWLIFLELVVVRFLGWQFNFDYRLTLLIVLWALGWSMYCSIGACFYAGVVGYGFRGGVNRGSQLARRHPILKSNLVNPTFPQHPMERRSAFRVCFISAHSLGRSHRGGLWSRANLQVAA